MDKPLSYYQSLPYTKGFEIVTDDPTDVHWLAWIVELDGCFSVGKTQVEAAMNLDTAFADHITSLLEWGEVPSEPEPTRVEDMNLVATEASVSLPSYYELLFKQLVERHENTVNEVEGTHLKEISSTLHEKTVNRADTVDQQSLDVQEVAA